jgi:tetratricopeptide (TPR) repeat protein
MNKRTALASTILLGSFWIATPAIAENFQHLQQLMSTKECTGCDLSGSGLVRADLAGARLSGANLTRANLSRANLAGADLSGANLSGASLFGANLTGANLTGANLRGTDLREAYLVDVDFTDALVDSAYVQDAVGMPSELLSVEEVYNWGVAEAKRKNHKKAIAYFNRALSLDPEFAPAYLARAVVRAETGDTNGAIGDAEIASKLFAIENNPQAFDTSRLLVAQLQALQDPERQNQGQGGSFLRTVGAIGISILRLML